MTVNEPAALPGDRRARHAHNTAMPSTTLSGRTDGPSIWRPPSLSLRWWPVFLRNLLVWRKLAIPSLVGNIAEPLMWLVAFGYGMGALVGELSVNGTRVPYILFLASGSICMSAMNAASFEALYSAFSRMHVQKTWDGIMNTPVGLDDVVLAEMLWAAFKALITVTAILGVMLALGISHSPKLLVAWGDRGVPRVVMAGLFRKEDENGNDGLTLTVSHGRWRAPGAVRHPADTAQ